MTKFTTLAAASVLALAGAAAVAQTATPTPQPQGQAQGQQDQGPGQGQGQGDNARRRGFNRADFEALTDARIAGIQAGLRLNADQQKLWNPVEQAMRGMAAERTQRFEEFRRGREAGQQEPQRPDLAQRLEQQAQRQTESAQRLTTLANTVKPFWASLDDNQKRLLPVLMRQGGDGGRSGGMMGRMRDHGGRGGMDHGHMGGPRRP
jgi:zinc resistance-associated protein